MSPQSFLIAYAAFASAAFLLVMFALRWYFRHRHSGSLQMQKTVVLVTITKEAAEKEEDKKKELKQKIAVVETFYTTLAATRSKDHIRDFFFGREDEISLEVVAHDGLVKFYIVMPTRQKQFVEQQLLAQYPSANVEVVEDYNIFTAKGEVFGAAMTLGKYRFLPLRTYQKMDSDPLDSLTNVMSKLADRDGMAYQILLRPARHGWGWRLRKIAHEMQRGKKLKQLLRKWGSTGVRRVWWSVWLLFSNPEKKKDKDEGGMGMNRITPGEEEMVKALEAKAGKAGFEANIRIIASGENSERVEQAMESLMHSFSQYDSLESSAHLKKVSVGPRVVRQFIYRTFDKRARLLLDTEELASMFHLPLPTTETPNIQWMTAKKAAAPVNVPREGLVLGYNEYRGVKTEIHIKREDRRRHMYIIGRSGVGKSVLQENCIIQDIINGEGVAVIDPHGDLVEAVLPYIPKNRIEDVVLFNPSDVERPMGLNMLEFHTEEQKDFAVQEMVAIFYKLFGQEMIGPMFEHYMRNAMLALMEDKEDPGTIVEIPRMFTDKEFRRKKLAKVQNVVVKNFWEQEYEQSQRGQQSADMLSYVISKIGRFLTNDMMRNIVGQPKSGFDFRDIMDKQKILLVNLSKGNTGEVNSSLLGLILVSKLQMAALSRANVAQSQRKDFYLYIDEFQNFITDSIATILSEARKYLLNLIIAHQYVGQLVQNNDTKIRDAVFGNAGTLAAFRVGVEDAEMLAKEFAPVFNEYDVINIEKYTAYVKLLIDNTASRAFNMKTYPPKKGGDARAAELIKQYSRLKYGRDRRIVEAEIRERSRLDSLGGRQAAPLEASL